MMTSESVLSKPFSEELNVARPIQRPLLSRRLFLHLLTLCEVAIEFATCTTVVALVGLLYKPDTYSTAALLKVATVAGVCVAVLLQGRRQRHQWSRNDAVQETAGILSLSLQAVAILLLALALMGPSIAIQELIIAILVLPPVLMFQKQLLLRAIRKLHSHGHGVDRVVIYGAGETGRRVASELLASPRLALTSVAIVDEDNHAIKTYGLDAAYRNDPAITVECVSFTPELLQRFHCNLLILTKDIPAKRMECYRAAATRVGGRIAHCMHDEASQSLVIDGLWVTCDGAMEPAWYYASCKRIIDLCVASALLLVLSPFFLLISLIIRFTSPGPALFVQQRVGRDGVLFKMYKFRSMSSHARPYERSPKTSQDPRITPIGRFLRSTSLDELPQLLNVFLGQMSLVGPRPEMPFIVRQYNAQQRRRLEAMPGITGLWQLSADRAYPIHENIHHDLSYLRRRTLSLDFAILMHTVFFAMRGGV
jgi:lipopolysaccharide/colanic/teichoic acid biosynthesis glycosyltransferase